MKNLLYLLILILPVQTVNATENLQQLYRSRKPSTAVPQIGASSQQQRRY